MLSRCFNVFFSLCFGALPVASSQGDILAIVPVFDPANRSGYLVDFPETSRGSNGQETPTTIVQCRDVSYRIPLDRSTYYKCCRRNLYYARQQFCIYDAPSSSAPAMSTPGYDYQTTRRPFNFFEYSTATAAHYWPFVSTETPAQSQTIGVNPLTLLPRVVCNGIAYYFDPLVRHNFKCCGDQLYDPLSKACSASQSIVRQQERQSKLYWVEPKYENAVRPVPAETARPQPTTDETTVTCNGRKFYLAKQIAMLYACCDKEIFQWPTHQCLNNIVTPPVQQTSGTSQFRLQSRMEPAPYRVPQNPLAQPQDQYSITSQTLPPLDPQGNQGPLLVPLIQAPSNAQQPAESRYVVSLQPIQPLPPQHPVPDYRRLSQPVQQYPAVQYQPQITAKTQLQPVLSCPSTHVCCERFLPVKQNPQKSLKCCQGIGPYDSFKLSCLIA